MIYIKHQKQSNILKYKTNTTKRKSDNTQQFLKAANTNSTVYAIYRYVYTAFYSVPLHH